MKKNLLLLISVIMFTDISFGQLSGTYYIPNGGGTPSYATIQAAVADLNTLGISGNVTFLVAAGYTESVTAPILLTATGTAGNTIVFQKDGPGTNPVITRTDAGTVSTTQVDAQGDGIIIIEGSDYVTYDGIDVTSQNEGIEYGYYLRKASATDACKNVTIKNSVVTMTKGTSPYVCGIYSSNNDAATLPSNFNGITVTSTGGRTENLLIIGNTVQNTHCGIRIRGFNHTVSPYQFLDQNNIVGQSGAGNIVQNFGGGTSAQFVHGIYVIYQTNAQMNFNTIDNAAGGGTASTSNLHGIFLNGSVGGGDVQINNNNIKLSQDASNYVYCIVNNAVTCSSIEIKNNLFSFGFYKSTSPSYLIYNSSATNNVTVTGNSNLPFTKNAVGNLYGYYCSPLTSPTGGTANISNNTFSNITMAGGSFWGINHSTNNQVVTIANNSIKNLINYGNSIGILQGRGNAGSTVSNNIIENWSGGGNFTGISAGNPASLGVSVSNNRVRNITTTNTGASLYVYGILTTFGNPCSIFNNEVYNLEANNSNATVYGINVGSSFGTSVHNIYNNFVSDLRTPITNAAINLAGISVLYGTTVNVFNNTVYLNATSSGALFGSAAIYAAGSSANPVLDLRNNVLVNVSVPNGTGITAAYRRSNSTLTNYSNNSNANCFYAGTPGPNNLIFFDGTTPYQTLSAYQSLVAPRDAASFTENPPFINVAATPYDLHIQTGVNTLCESGGLVVSSPFAVTNDFDSQPRYPNSGYPDNPGQPATAPDAGADEFAGGLLPPSLTFTVDMSTAEGFAPGADVVYLAGSFPGATWNEPGTNPALMMAQVGSTLIYTLTLTLPAGTYEYKYFKNAGWGGAEWAVGSNRSATFATTTTLYDTWGGSISWANLQYPGSGNITEGGTYAVYGQAYIPNGITYAPGVAYGLEAWVGISSTNTDPTGWTTWIPATFNTQAANNDEFTANIATGLTAGTYYYAFRYRFGQTYGEYLYGGFSAGYWNGTTNVNGVLTVDPPATKTLNLSLYLEGLYAGSNIMNKAQDEMGDHFPGTVADQITVELHNHLDYLTIEYQAQNVDLNTDGTATILIPNIYSGMYWLTIKHRNSVETTSSVVVDFSGAMISYDFTTQATQAYGDNMKDLGEGVFGLFVGDANQDGLIDGDDLAFMDSAVIAGNIGYLASDLNGDGLVDGDDLVKGETNFTTGIALVTP